MKAFKSVLVLTLLLGDFGTPPTPAKDLSAVYTTPMLAMKPSVLLAEGTAATCPRVPSAVGSAVGILLILLLYCESRCQREKPLRKTCCKVQKRLTKYYVTITLMTTLCVGGTCR